MTTTETDISKVFDNRDFGYYKLTIERPLRLAAQFTPEKVATLRFQPALVDVMEWAYGKYGEAVYDGLADHADTIESHLEREEIPLSPRQRKDVLSPTLWKEQRGIMEKAEKLMGLVGQALSLDFNAFVTELDAAVEGLGFKLPASERKQILNAVSWREETAAKVIKKSHTLTGKKLKEKLTELRTEAAHLADFGLWPSDKAGEYIEYETDSELRDTENVPLKDDIHGHFLREVRPHVADAWIALAKTVIGYEISFNKVFYRHKPLRDLTEVTAEILTLEAETEGLLKKLVSFVGQNL